MSQLTNHPQVSLTPEQVESLRKSIVSFTGYQGKLDEELDRVMQIGEIADEEARNEAHAIISQSSRVLKEHSALRLEVTRPLDALKKGVTTYEKAEQAPLSHAIDEVKQRISSFDNEKERQRQEELRRLIAEREARLEAVRREHARVDEHRSLLFALKTQVSHAIDSASTSHQVKDLMETIDSYLSRDWEEFTSDWKDFRNIAMVDLRQLKSRLYQIEAASESERTKLEAQNQRKREAQQAQREAEEAKAEAERKQREAEEQARREAERKAEEARLRELKAARAKGLSSGLDTVEITDLDAIPKHIRDYILKIEVKRSNLLSYLREEDITEIPGLAITFKTKIIMNG